MLPAETLAALLPTPPAGPPRVYVDATLGRGGHSLLLAGWLRPEDRIVGLDVDARNLAFAADRLLGAPCGFEAVRANFADLPRVLEERGLTGKIAGLLADLGVSTNQLFDAHYGLSFRDDAPLDMRLDASSPVTAADLVNKLPERELADVLFQLADERASRKIARRIAEARAVAPIRTTSRLADVVRAALGGARPSGKARGRGPRRSTESAIDPATRTFLALRMKVNREAENLQDLLREAPALLVPGGRLAVISFQSTEDRLVKHALRAHAAAGRLRVVTARPVTPTEDESARNPRARSSKLRVAERLATETTP